MEVFDWVTARSKCSLKATYAVLAEAVESDVKKARGLNLGELTFKWAADDKFLVLKGDAASVVFHLDGGKIRVYRGSPDPQPHLIGKPALSIDGACRLEVEGEPEPLELWQFSRKALEAFFFGA